MIVLLTNTNHEFNQENQDLKLEIEQLKTSNKNLQDNTDQTERLKSNYATLNSKYKSIKNLCNS